MQRIALFSMLLVSLAGCYIEIVTPSGGTVRTVSGDHACTSNQTCKLEVTDLTFDEAFYAIPDDGMKFSHWQRQTRSFFGGSMNPEARLTTSGLAGNEALVDVLESDTTFYLRPIFEPLGGGKPLISGGSPSNPGTLLPGTKHSVQNNAFYNYFRYSGSAGEKLFLKVDLSVPLSQTQRSRCASSSGTGTRPSAYDTQMHIYDIGLNRIGGICSDHLIFTIPESGDYIIQFDYPDNGGGIAEINSISGDSAIKRPIDNTGTPAGPRPIFPDTMMQLAANDFQNYFRYTATKDSRIILDVQLDSPLTEQQLTRCASNSGTGTRPSSYNTQIHVYDDDYNRIGGKCGDDLNFVFPASGTYILHFEYGNQSAGHFVAAVID